MALSRFELVFFAVLFTYTTIQYMTSLAKIDKDQQQASEVKKDRSFFESTRVQGRQETFLADPPEEEEMNKQNFNVPYQKERGQRVLCRRYDVHILFPFWYPRIPL